MPVEMSMALRKLKFWYRAESVYGLGAVELQVEIEATCGEVGETVL
jgi:hypothetical protein